MTVELNEQSSQSRNLPHLVVFYKLQWYTCLLSTSAFWLASLQNRSRLTHTSIWQPTFPSLPNISFRSFTPAVSQRGFIPSFYPLHRGLTGEVSKTKKHQRTQNWQNTSCHCWHMAYPVQGGNQNMHEQLPVIKKYYGIIRKKKTNLKSRKRQNSRIMSVLSNYKRHLTSPPEIKHYLV